MAVGAMAGTVAAIGRDVESADGAAVDRDGCFAGSSRAAGFFTELSMAPARAVSASFLPVAERPVAGACLVGSVPGLPCAGEVAGEGAAGPAPVFGTAGFGPGVLLVEGMFAAGAGSGVLLPLPDGAGAAGPGLGTGLVFADCTSAACGAEAGFWLPGPVAGEAFSGLGLAATGVPGFGGFTTKAAGLPLAAGLGFVFVSTAGVRVVPFAEVGALSTAEAGLLVAAGCEGFTAAGPFAAAAALPGVGRAASDGTAFFAGTPFFDAGCFGMLALPRMDSTMLDIRQADNLPIKSMTPVRM